MSTVKEWMEKEKKVWELAQPIVKEMQSEYFEVIERLLYENEMLLAHLKLVSNKFNEETK